MTYVINCCYQYDQPNDNTKIREIFRPVKFWKDSKGSHYVMKSFKNVKIKFKKRHLVKYLN